MLNKITLLSFIICQTSITTASNNDNADKLNKYNIPSQIKTGFLASASAQQEAMQADLEVQQRAYMNFFVHRFATVVGDAAQEILPREIIDHVPPVVINSCAFSQSDTSDERALKLSKLAMQLNKLELPDLDEAKRNKISAIAFIMTANSCAKVAAETRETASDFWISGAQYLRWGMPKIPAVSKKHYVQQAISWLISAQKELPLATEDMREKLRLKIIEELKLLKEV